MRIMQPNRVTHTYQQRLKALPATVFPLLCPVRETEWANEWSPELVVSKVVSLLALTATKGSPSPPQNFESTIRLPLVWDAATGKPLGIVVRRRAQYE